jgi:Tol biopolymer transport system component
MAFATLLGGSPASAAFPGSNGMIAFGSERDGVTNREIYAMGPDGSTQTNLTNNAAFDDEPAWSPDGAKIAFSSSRDGNSEVYAMDVDGANVVRLTTNVSFDGRPAWSPDGTQIAFASNRTSNFEIFVMNADGSSQTNITNNAGLDDQPAWSPDGTKIAFASSRDGDMEVFSMNANGSSQTNLTNNAAYSDQAPNWSPDGTKIVFQSNQDGEGDDEIYSMFANGSSPTRITFDVVSEGSPVWSPDGAKIAFSKFTTNHDIFVMDANGSNQQQLTTASATDTVADWQAGAAVGGMTELADPLLNESSGSAATFIAVVAFAAMTGLTAMRLRRPGAVQEPRCRTN